MPRDPWILTVRIGAFTIKRETQATSRLCTPDWSSYDKRIAWLTEAWNELTDLAAAAPAG
jgi:hypothetical protein